jgi:EAL domain-containing protein (putative c-di-GMP-specific phosphodiesterase class I)/GGDEF domain-containing protein
MQYKNKLLLNVSLIIFLIYAVVASLYYYNVLSNASSTMQHSTQQNAKLINENLSKYILKNDNHLIEALTKMSSQLTNITNINIHYSRLIFTLDTLINSLKTQDSSIILSDIATDVKYGEIKNVVTGIYEFVPTREFELTKFIDIKFQLQKNIDFQSDYFPLKFNAVVTKKSEEIQQASKLSKSLFNLKSTQYQFSVKYNNEDIAFVELVFDNNYFINSAFNELKLGLLFISLLFLIAWILVVFKINKVVQKDVLNVLKDINKIGDEILTNDYRYSRTLSKYNIPEFSTLDKSLDLIAKKMAQTLHDLGVAQKTSSKQLYADPLTGLHNKKIFDDELKYTFVTKDLSFVFLIKLDSLKDLLNVAKTEVVDEFIVDFSKLLEQSAKKYNISNVETYRFYGGEFAILTKGLKLNIAQELIQELVKNINILLENKRIKSFKYHIGGTPVDVYGGTIDSTLKLASKAYRLAQQNNTVFHLITPHEEVSLQYEKLESYLPVIINEKKLSVSLGFPTYDLNDNNKIIMKDVIVQVLDEDGLIIPMGVLVSFMEKNDLIGEFDKLVMEIATSYILVRNIDYKVCVNLSFKSILDVKFMMWLEKFLKENKSLSQKLIFSFSAYSAKIHEETFKFFISKIRYLNSRVLVKRYNYDEYSIDTLGKLDIDYLRVHRSIVNDFKDENSLTRKKEILQHIVLSANINDYEVLADELESSESLEFLKKIGLSGAMLKKEK